MMFLPVRKAQGFSPAVLCKPSSGGKLFQVMQFILSGCAGAKGRKRKRGAEYSCVEGHRREVEEELREV